MIYGIILLILYTLATAYSMWTYRTQESCIKYHQQRIEAESNINKIEHYIAYACAQIINLSILGYLIYALTCL